MSVTREEVISAYRLLLNRDELGGILTDVLFAPDERVGEAIAALAQPITI